MCVSWSKMRPDFKYMNQQCFVAQTHIIFTTLFPVCSCRQIGWVFSSFQGYINWTFKKTYRISKLTGKKKKYIQNWLICRTPRLVSLLIWEGGECATLTPKTRLIPLKQWTRLSSCSENFKNDQNLCFWIFLISLFFFLFFFKTFRCRG